MASLDRDQLDALKRQLEEEFRMDMAAIERLQRRFMGAHDPVATVLPPAGNVIETRASGLSRLEPARELSRQEPAKPEPSAQADSDDLSASLRTMFGNYRK